MILAIFPSLFFLIPLIFFCSKAKKTPNEKNSKENTNGPVKSASQLAKEKKEEAEWKVIDDDRKKYKEEKGVDDKIREKFQCTQTTNGSCNFVDSIDGFVDNERYKLEKYWRYKFNLFGWLSDEEDLLKEILECFEKTKGDHPCLQDQKKMDAFKDKMKNIEGKLKEISGKYENYRKVYIIAAKFTDMWCICGEVENFNEEVDVEDHCGHHCYKDHYDVRAKDTEWIERQKKYPDLCVEYKGWSHYRKYC